MPTGTSLIADLLKPDGPVARAMSELSGMAYEVRPQQARLCEEVALTLQKRAHLLAEAGTGVGKSFAYLLPAALRAVIEGETVVVSTHTISLQEQLLQKDIPVVERVIAMLRERGALPVPSTPDGEYRALKPVLVKGRGNYVSIRRLALASQRQDKLFADPAAKRSLHVIEDWAMQTEDGTLSSLPAVERMGVWDKVQSDSGNCMGKRCPTYEKCFYQSARREMEGANLLVCNHALFFSDLALRVQDAGFMPRYDHVIFDEGHTVEDVAGEHFGVSLSEGRVAHLLSTLASQRSGKGYLPQLALSSGDNSGLERAIGLVMRAGEASRAFFEDLLAIAQRSTPRGREGDGGGWISGPTSRGSEPLIHRVREAGVVENGLSAAMRDLSTRLRALREDAKLEADKFELNAYALRAEMIAQDAGTLVEQALPGCAYWIEVTGGEEGGPSSRRVTLACAPIEIAQLLKDRLFHHQCSVVLTSATLATRKGDGDGAFAHALRQLGCEGAATLQLGSPFDYAKQAEVFVERVGVQRRAGQGAQGTGDEEWGGGGGGYHDQLARAILKHVRATDGGAFVLFTSFATLLRTGDLLRRDLERLGMPLLAQGRDGSRTQILQRFREDHRSVLLGAASFWQGVDVRGEGLRNVIITKLPFDPPDRPLVQARGELIQQRGGNPFMEDALPRAVLKFKQGFGRLIRSSSDRGRVVILDERVVTTRYGRAFLDALPEGVRVRVAEAGEE